MAESQADLRYQKLKTKASVTKACPLLKAPPASPTHAAAHGATVCSMFFTD